jgi:hypothetical protein
MFVGPFLFLAKWLDMLQKTKHLLGEKKIRNNFFHFLTKNCGKKKFTVNLNNFSNFK